jgi:hypothetical protein
VQLQLFTDWTDPSDKLPVSKVLNLTDHGQIHSMASDKGVRFYKLRRVAPKAGKNCPALLRTTTFVRLGIVVAHTATVG